MIPTNNTCAGFVCAIFVTLLVLLGKPALAAESDALEEIVVTAQKREQSLQDVSIAITAFDSSELAALGTSNLEELTEFVASAELFDDRGAGQPSWVIRGVGLADFNANNTPTAAIYYDEFYLTSNVLGGIGLFDMERIEILKGPQGGLYGRNTSGGAVRVISKQPSTDDGTNGYVSASHGRWDQINFEGALGTALSDKAAIRVSTMVDQGGGWQDSVATAENDEHGDRDFLAVRAQLALEPSQDLDILLKVEGGSDQSETSLGYSRALFDPLTGDFCASALAGVHDEQNCITLSNLTNALVLTPGDLGALPPLQNRDGTTVLSKPINELDNDWFGATLRINWELGNARLSSITGYLDFEQNQVYDFDAQPLALFEEDSTAEITSWSQEFRLVSTDDGVLSWLAGVMFANDQVDELRRGDLSENFLVFPTIALRGFSQEADSWAAYGQLDYEASDTVSLHGSLRYTSEDKGLEDAFFEDIPGAFFYIQGVDKTVELEDSWSGHIGIDWRVADDALLYGRVIQGFKSGGFFGGFAFSSEELDPYKEETVLSYEVGMKSTWVDGRLRLNSAAYFYDYQDVQGFTQVFSPILNTVITKLGNLGDAEHTGLEMDLQWLPSSAPGLNLQLSAAWMDAEISDSTTLGLDQLSVAVPIEGLQRAYSPDLSPFAQAQYDWAVSSELNASAQLNYSWRDDIAGEDANLSLLDFAAFGHEGYGVLNARASLSASDGR